jgi:hypothetical protein
MAPSQIYSTLPSLYKLTVSTELKTSLASVQKHMQALEAVVSQLDAIGLEMTDITAEETQLTEQVPARLEGLKAHQGAMVELDAYYVRYTEAYTALVQEMARRNAWFRAVDDIVGETRRKLELLREGNINHIRC